MQKILIVAAALSPLVIPAEAAPYETPYALSAVHADFQAQLEKITTRPGEIGAAARAAAELMALQNAAQERLVLPLLGWVGVVPTSRMVDLPDRMRIEAELSQLYDGDVNLVTALVELYAVADENGDAETTRLAETMIWHQTSDIDVLYPSALLVDMAARAHPSSAHPATVTIPPDPLMKPSSRQ
ncbi:hypothetical protein [Sinisalibacter aestuarii]|uniref:Uncharacterized protein n=1 Tax=Sinisalibacter aestuarii TaxID=2949426 RepID=A0ABQ5LY68_9RHOB|nr:hypothetical protein [Sinisalibacter aestuarii]GKY89918.1 hypothetical protein STA1M1_37870 [Sinisalibacter aestuarii]